MGRTMQLHQVFRSQRRVLASFLAVMLVLGAAFAWLGWRLLQQDRLLERQRTQERLEHAADRVLAALQQSVSEFDDLVGGSLSRSNSGLSRKNELQEGVLLLVAGPQSVETYPDRLLYYPDLPLPAEPDASLFQAGEILEYQQNNPIQAIAAFQSLASSRDPAVRAAALVRLGRNLRKAGRFREALEVYSELEKLGPAFVGGVPADLVAREARCSVLEQTGEHNELKREAKALYADLQAGRWRLMRSAYQFHSQEARSWMGAGAVASYSQEGLALAKAVEWLWQEWKESQSEGRRFLSIEDQPMLLVWAARADRLAAVVAGPRYLEGFLRKASNNLGVRVGLADAEGRLLLGQGEDPTRPQVLRMAAEGMPWIVHVASADANAEQVEFTDRRRLLSGGLALVALVLLAGTYFIWRAITRELAVAQLQSDFVAAVSHEFRTPLTAVRQFSELLAKDRVPTEPQRRQVYQYLVKESERLQRLVEGLLDFGRMEGGAQTYRFEPLDIAELVRDVSAEFQEKVAAQGYRIEVSLESSCPALRGDREALGRAVWNLLDNAVKYSPECKTVWISVARDGERAALRVRDGGLGIPLEEQKQIFRKFVRGSHAKNSAVQGTGIGLAMVHHIVRAHGGEIRLESEPGRGSTFTLLLPTADLVPRQECL